MSIINRKQSQFELFPRNTDQPAGSEPQCNLLKNLTLSIENLIIFCIIIMISMIITFSYGVERGKVLKNTPLAATENNSPQNEKSGIISASVEGPADASNGALGGMRPAKEGVVEEKIEILDLPELEEELIENPYTIQVASFKLEKNAKKEAKRLEDIGEDIYVVSKGSYSIVCVGKFLHRDDAKEFSGKLKKKYKDLLVRRL